MINVIKGDVFYRNNIRIEVLSVSPNDVVLKGTDPNTNTVHHKIVSHDDLFELLDSGALKKRFDICPPPVRLTEFRKKKCERLTPYLEIMQERYENGETTTSITAYRQICQEIEAKYPKISHRHFSSSALARYFKKLRDKESVEELFRLSGLQGNRLKPDIKKHLTDSLQTDWVETRSESIYGAFKHYRDSAIEKNHGYACYSTYRRYVKGMPEADKTIKHSDYATRNKITATRLRKVEVRGVLHRVEIDRCDLDLALLNDDGTSTDSISIYAAIDVYSRAIIGLTMEIGTHEDTEGVVRLLSQLYMNRSEAPYNGHIRNIVRDNGPGFKSKIVRNIISKLTTSVIGAPAQTPQSKGHIESFFNVLGQHLMSAKIIIGKKKYRGVPGYLGVLPKKSKIENVIETKKRALIGIAAFKEIMRKFVVDYNHIWPHSEIRMTPNEKWLEGAAMLPPIPVDYHDVRHIFHYAEDRRKLTDGGVITIDTQKYCSEELAALRLVLKTSQNDESPYVIVRTNPCDASAISVYATTPSGEAVHYIIEHDKWSKSNSVVSFAEVKNAPVIRSSLFTVTLGAEFEKKPVKTKKQKSDNSRISSFDENRQLGLDALGIIDRSNEDYEKRFDPQNSMQIQAAKSHKPENDDKKPNAVPSMFDGEEFW